MGRPRKHPVRAKHKVSVGMEMIGSDQLIAQLEELVYMVQVEVIEKAVTAGTKPVLAAMIANSPESSGSLDKQSATTRERWRGSKKLKNTMRAVVRPRVKFGQIVGRYGLVGPSYSDGGGHGNLFSKDHKRKVLWGRDAGGVRVVNQFVKRTADQTSAAAGAAAVRALKSGIEAAANSQSMIGK